MTYEFGNYKVKTEFLPGGLFTIPRWKQTTYYKDSYIYSSDYHSAERHALQSAQYEIGRHKNILNWMKQNV